MESIIEDRAGGPDLRSALRPPASLPRALASAVTGFLDEYLGRPGAPVREDTPRGSIPNSAPHAVGAVQLVLVATIVPVATGPATRRPHVVVPPMPPSQRLGVPAHCRAADARTSWAPLP